MLRQLIEPVQLLYVMMFSTSLIHMDKIYVDKVCQVNLRDWIHELNLTTDVCHNLTRCDSNSINHFQAIVHINLKYIEPFYLLWSQQ